LKNAESAFRAVCEEIEELHRKIQLVVLKREELQSRLRETKLALATQKDSTNDVNEQATIMSKFLEKDEETLKALQQASQVQKNHIFKLSQEVYKARKREKNLLAEIQGSQNRVKNFVLRIQELDREAQKQMELSYSFNFQIVQLGRKVARIQGERTEEERLELQSQIDHLTEVLDSKAANEKMLLQQLHRLELELRQNERLKEAMEEEERDLGIKFNELNMDQESIDKSMGKVRGIREKLLVHFNLLRLQIEKLTWKVNSKADEVVTLENRKQQLQLSMAERLAEIDAHIAALRVRLKTEEEARHADVVELQERKRRLDALNANYETVMGRYRVDGEEVSEAYHVIRFAQKREELARKADELEDQVRVALVELRELERTMMKFNGQNASYRMGFETVEEGDGDLERKMALEDERKVAMQRLKTRKAEARSVAEERAAAQSDWEQRQRQVERLQARIQRWPPAIEKLGIEVNQLGEKIKVAELACKRACDAHRRSAGVPPNAPYPASLFEMDVELRMEQHLLDWLVTNLSKMSEKSPEIEPKLNLGLVQTELKPPSASPRSPAIATPAGSSRCPSARSGVTTVYRLKKMIAIGKFVSRPGDAWRDQG
jgi:chromosome segregation ATPase